MVTKKGGEKKRRINLFLLFRKLDQKLPSNLFILFNKNTLIFITKNVTFINATIITVHSLFIFSKEFLHNSSIFTIIMIRFKKIMKEQY